MNIEFTLLWLVTLLPIVISPGPANILYAASGSSFGVKGTIPFWLATNITSIFQTLAVGFGLNFLISACPQITYVIKYLGIIFLLYLAFKFFKMSNTLKETIKMKKQEITGLPWPKRCMPKKEAFEKYSDLYENVLLSFLFYATGAERIAPNEAYPNAA
ncbi:MAG: LysE family transporter [Kiritimatiellae bacterium]|jgi:threonine/homoserine/homoserine lactone efflux protein|nr:LysE family transporter [Kiritimatiellia bacterium]